MLFEEDQRLLARVFTRPVFSALSDKQDAKRALRFLLNDSAFSKVDLGQPLFQLFQSYWQSLLKSYRSEYVYKNMLATKLIFGRHSPRTTAFFTEFSVGKSIADVVIVNGATTVYEIKTEFDSVRRLATQLNDYKKAFDKIFIVTDPDKVAQTLATVDDAVGVLSLTNNGTLRSHRDASVDIQKIDPLMLFRCLRRSEYVTGLEPFFGPVAHLPNGVIAAECEKLFLQLHLDDARAIFLRALKSRTNEESFVNFVASLPASLKALGYATPLSSTKREGIISILQKPVGEVFDF